MESLIMSVIALIVSIVALAFAVAGRRVVMREPQVAVKIYKHRESGNLIYCRTGTLTNDLHSYEGEGQIGESKAVEC